MAGRKGMRKRKKLKEFCMDELSSRGRQAQIVKGMGLSHYQAQQRYKLNPPRQGTYRASNGVTLPLTTFQQVTPDPA